MSWTLVRSLLPVSMVCDMPGSIWLVVLVSCAVMLMKSVFRVFMLGVSMQECGRCLMARGVLV